jgi:hypothetical protein
MIDKYIKALRRNGYIMLPTLMEANHGTLDGITIYVENIVQKDMFQRELKRLKQHLGEVFIQQVETKVNADTYTEQDKVEHMISKNPKVKDLINLLNLKI